MSTGNGGGTYIRMNRRKKFHRIDQALLLHLETLPTEESRSRVASGNRALSEASHGTENTTEDEKKVCLELKKFCHIH